MILTSSKVMGTVVGSRWQMQALKDGRMTCVLKVGFTPVKKWVRFVALHPGVNARNAGWNEELVARLRKDARGGGCVLGPFSSAESLWEASQSKDGREFKLGMSLKELKVWMRWMARLGKGGKDAEVYVYRFHPAEVNPDIVWNDAYHVGDDWASGFVRSRSQRGKGGVRFHVKRLTVVRQDQEEREQQPLVVEDEEWGPSFQRQALGSGGGGDGMFRAFPVTPESQTTVDMAQRTQEVARVFREAGQRNGMDVIVLIAVEKMEEALGRVGQTLRDGSLYGLTVALFDLRMAIDEYGWAIHLCGWDAGYLGRVQDLARVVAGIERNMEYSLHLMALSGNINNNNAGAAHAGDM